MIDLRTLLYRVASKRPDREESIQMEAFLGMQSAARDLMRQALCWQVETTGTLDSANGSVHPVVVDDQDVNGVDLTVRPIRTIHLEIDISTTGTPLWSGIRDLTLNEFKARGTYPATPAIPTYYADQFGLIHTDSLLDKDYDFKATVAIEPTDWFEALPIPSEFENVLVEGGLAEVWDLPGTLQDVNRAELHKKKFWMRMTEATSAMEGTSGLPVWEFVNARFGPPRARLSRRN